MTSNDEQQIKTFRHEAISWIESLGYGYSLYASANDLRYYTLMFTSEWDDMPAIDCRYDIYLGESSCKLKDSTYPLLLSMTTPELVFKHPDIKQFIAAFKYYAWLARHYELDVQMIEQLVKSLDNKSNNKRK